MKLVNENVTRKIDSLGRIGIPKGMRDRMRLEVNQEMEFYTLTDDAGRDYVCFAAQATLDKYDIAVNILRGLGIDMSREALEKMGGDDDSADV